MEVLPVNSKKSDQEHGEAEKAKKKNNRVGETFHRLPIFAEIVWFCQRNVAKIVILQRRQRQLHSSSLPAIMGRSKIRTISVTVSIQFVFKRP